MPTLLLDNIIGGAGKPYVRNFWNHTEGSKKVQKLKFLIDPYLYTDTTQALARATGTTVGPVYGDYQAGRECIVKASSTAFTTEGATTVAHTNTLYTCTNGLDFTSVTLPSNSYQPTGLVFFNNKWWIFTGQKTLISTDNTASSFVASTATPPVRLYKPFVFSNRILLVPYAASNVLRSTTDGETFATYTLPISGDVMGMATDGTTLMIAMVTTTGIGGVWKTTDLTNWTAVDVRYTATSGSVANTGTSLSNTGLYPLGVVYTGSKFVLMAADVSITSLAFGNITFVRFFTAANSSSNFVLSSSFRMPKTDSVMFSGSGVPLNQYQLQFSNGSYKRTAASANMVVTSNKIVATLSAKTSAWGDATTYNYCLACQIYSNDGGDTWDMIDIPPDPFVVGATTNIVIPTASYSTPWGVTTLIASNDSNPTTGYFRPNPDAKELVMSIRG